MVKIESSIGELLDKISILKIKKKKISSESKLINIENELDSLSEIANKFMEVDPPAFENFMKELVEVNSNLWETEDKIRVMEKTKNSFVDEIKKQYVITAKAKGLPKNRVLYGHVFRNAMLIIIAGFPGLFIGVFFGGSLIIETIFSLDGLGRLGFEAALTRDYPVMFGTLYFFGLLGLIIGLISDLVYVVVDPRIDFESRNT